MGLSIAPHAGGPVPRQTPSFETPSFFGGDTGITYEELQARKKIARELMGGNGQIRSVGEGINSAAKSVAGALLKKRAQTEEDKQRSEFNDAFNSTVPGMFGGATGTLSTKGSPYAEAIASVESAGSGDYSAVGPQTPKGRAYGRYQVMDFNIPAWTEKYVGRRMTPEEFLRDPAAQDAVFNGEFGSYVQKYGNPQDAASMWFSGRPMAEAGNASDGYKTVPEYVSKFDRALGGRASTKGVQVAQAGGVDPSIIQKLAELAGSPYASPGQKAIVNALLGQKIQAMQPPDPLQELQRRKLEMEIERMGQSPQGFDMLSPEELAQYGLEGPHQRGPDGRIYPLKREPLVSIGDTLSPGQEAADKEYGKTYVEWTQGGSADALANIKKIEDVISTMEAGETNLTGPLIGLAPKVVRDLVAPESSFAQEQVEEVIQRNLRIILGAQFTEKEGQRLIERAYNPRLSEDQNAARLKQLLAAMKQAAEAKQSQAEYFEKNGTIRGWTGKEWNLEDFETAIDGGGGNKGDKKATHRFNPETGKIEEIQ